MLVRLPEIGSRLTVDRRVIRSINHLRRQAITIPIVVAHLATAVILALEDRSRSQPYIDPIAPNPTMQMSRSSLELMFRRQKKLFQKFKDLFRLREGPKSQI
jgi:hypothetical protein